MVDREALRRRIQFLHAELGAIASWIELREAEAAAGVQGEVAEVVPDNLVALVAPAAEAVAEASAVEAAPEPAPARRKARHPDTVPWVLAGEPDFEVGSVEDAIWQSVAAGRFTRRQLVARIEALQARGIVPPEVTADTLARDFLGLVVDQGLADRAA